MKSESAVWIVAGIVGYLVLRNTIQQSINQAAATAGTAAGSSAVNTAVGDIGQIATALTGVFQGQP